MKIGIIYVAYGCKDYVVPSLTPWIELKKENQDNNDAIISIAAVSMPFEKFSGTEDGTLEILHDFCAKQEVDKVFTCDFPVKETEARTKALRYFVEQGFDLIIQWDADEFATVEQLKRIIAEVEGNPFDVWFKISYKNYVCSDKTYLKSPFQPARIFRLKTNTGAIADSFWDDNNVQYRLGTQLIRDIDAFPCNIIPKSIGWIRHLTWLNNERSKKKVEYQVARGWTCSYSWNYETNQLEFNKEYYKKNMLPPPILLNDENTV